MKLIIKILIYLGCALIWLLILSNALAAEEISKYKSIEVNKVELINKLHDQIIKENHLKLEKEYDELVEVLRIENEEVTRQRISDKIKAERLIELEKIKNSNIEKSKNDNWVVYELTFYNLDYQSTGKNPGHPAFGITASGNKAIVGRTIACNKSIPLGTRVYIEGFGYRICEDRGGAIKGNLFDVLVESRSEAYRLGRIKARVKFEGVIN